MLEIIEKIVNFLILISAFTSMVLLVTWGFLVVFKKIEEKGDCDDDV